MKFLSFFPALFAVALAYQATYDSNGVRYTSIWQEEPRVQGEYLKGDVEDATERIEWLANWIATLEREHRTVESLKEAQSLKVVKVTQTLHDVKDQIESRAPKVVKAQQLLRDVKVEVETQNNRISSIEKRLEDSMVEGSSPLKQAVDGQKLFQRAKNQGKAIAEKVAKVEKLLRTEDTEGKKVVTAEKVLSDLNIKGKSQADELAKAQPLFRSIKEKGVSQKEQVTTVWPLIKSLSYGNKNREEFVYACGLTSAVWLEINRDYRKLDSAENLLDGAKSWFEAQAVKLTATKEVLEGLKAETESNVAMAEEILGEAKDQVQSQAEDIAKVERLLEEMAN